MDASEPIRIKEAKTFEEQLTILKRRGLAVENSSEAISTLHKVNYYRLIAYGLTLKDPSQKNNYRSGTTFNQLVALYDFDKKLRQLLIGVIESIEIAFRTHIAYHHAHTYGPLGYKEASNFKHLEYHEKFLINLDRSFKDNKRELFVAHHHEKYQGVFPIWVAVEVLSFSTLSMLFKNLKNKDQGFISKTYYNVPFTYTQSWLHTLTTIRNICAHHGRLYGRKLTIRPSLFDEVKKNIRSDELFAALFIACKLLDTKERMNFVDALVVLVEEYNEYVDVLCLGFPSDWKRYLSE